jgi:aminoglycoside 2''-phosphotransferase
MDIRIQKYLGSIKSVFPYAISSVIVHDGGDDFLVLEINHGWMFRFPRTDISRKALQVEKGFLAKFKTVSPLPVPDHQYFGDDFVGYPKITGELLELDVFRRLSNECLTRLARQFGQFLSIIHNFPVEEAKRIGLIEGWNGWQAKIIRNFRDNVAPVLTPSARQNGLACIEQMLAESFKLTVIHGDFALEDHVFFDGKKQRLSGVIDFADVTLNDPAHDFQNIVEYGGEEFFEIVMRGYQGREDPLLLRRTKLHIEARPFLEASSSLLFGFEKRFKERIKYIEARYE